MENAAKNQENEMRELSLEELVSINGGATVRYIMVDGKIILITVEDE